MLSVEKLKADKAEELKEISDLYKGESITKEDYQRMNADILTKYSRTVAPRSKARRNALRTNLTA